ncbi:probable aspartic proteinase GIP2 [Mercurialis annua]|uniref:probable aspartic proteinase GIP2 n=1 Tax=Mercurialis annua TaxID=3986 RepID=UPI002160D9E2|nr:probable aspartic proteinase GIP2 [Mercurialis annua]
MLEYHSTIMASLFDCFFLLFSLIFFTISPSSAKTLPFRPNTIVIPVSKDKCTNQYTIQISQRTPSTPVKLTVDLGGRFMWVNCEESYTSSTYKPAKCNSTLCSLANSKVCTTEPTQCSSSPRPGCNNNSTCTKFIQNRVVYIGTGGELGQDTVSIQFYNKNNPGRIVSLASFPFFCGITWLLDSLAEGVTGVAGFGRSSNISLPAYLSDSMDLPKKFAICLSSNYKNNGLIFFGNGPNYEPLTYTPLILNPVEDLITGGSADYYIGVKSIRVDGKKIKFDENLLSVVKDGSGGTMLSTVNPYTVLHTSIYKALLRDFTKKMELKFRSLVVPSVPVPFGACYYSSGFGTIEEFLAIVPAIDLELESADGKNVSWRFSGANSMVAVNSYTMCLAYIDGGSQPWAPIIIGGHQLEDTVLQFDLDKSRLGFSSNLVYKNTTCSNFVDSM